MAFINEGLLGVLRDEHFALNSGGCGVGRRGVTGVAGRGQKHGVGPERLRARDRRGQTAGLERVGGVERFILDQQPIEADGGAQPLRVEEGSEAFAERDRLAAGEQRHQLAIAPHVRRAIGQRLFLPRPRRLEIVAGEHRQLAGGAEKMRLTRIEGPRTASVAAFQMREVTTSQAAPGPSCSGARRSF